MLFNVITLNNYSTAWENATVIPFFKTGDKPGTARNYMPISLISRVDKVMELVGVNLLLSINI